MERIARVGMRALDFIGAFLMAMMVLLLAAVASASETGTLPQPVVDLVNGLGGSQVLGATMSAWIGTQVLKNKKPNWFSKLGVLAAPLVGTVIQTGYEGALAGLTGSGHIGADLGRGALIGLTGGILAIVQHNLMGKLIAPVKPPKK